MQISFILRPIALLPFIASVSVLITLIWFILKAKKTPSLFLIISLQACIFLWTFGQTLQCISSNNLTTIISSYIIHSSINVIPILWYIFVLLYTGKVQLFKPKSLFVISIPFLFNFIIYFSNPLHHLIIEEFLYNPENIIYVRYGRFFWIPLVVWYIYVFAAYVHLIRFSVNQTGYKKWQAIVMTATIIPVIASLYTLITVVNSQEITMSNFDYTPSFFTFSVVVYSIAAYKYKFLNIIPSSLEKVYENMRQGVAIVDSAGNIISFNSAFYKEFEDVVSNEENINTVSFFLRLTKYLDESRSEIKSLEKIITKEYIEHKETEFFMKSNHNNAIKAYRLNAVSIINKNKKPSGKILVFSDVTKYKDILNEITFKNGVLLTANRELNKMISNKEELSLVNERNRIAGKIHGVIEQKLNSIIVIIKSIINTTTKEPATIHGKIEELIQIASDGLTELRTNVKSLAGKEKE